MTMRGAFSQPGIKLRPRQHKAIMALIAGHTIVDSARIAGVRERVVRKWMKVDSNFATCLELARSCVFDEALSQLQLIMKKAVDTLDECLGSEKAAVRVNAARLIIENGLRSHEMRELKEEIKQIKAIVAVQHGPLLSYNATVNQPEENSSNGSQTGG